jgi:hypothetical protein
MTPVFRSLTVGLIFISSGVGAGVDDAVDDAVFLAPEASEVFRPVFRSISLPVEISPQHGIFVQASLNGSAPLWFLLDSASTSALILDQRRAVELKLPVHGRGLGVGAGEGTFDVTYSHGVSVSLAGVEFSDQTVAATPLDTLRRYAGRELDGILGHALFSRFVVEVEYAKGTVKLYEPQAYRYSGRGQVLPVSLEGRHFCIKAKIFLDGSQPIEGKLLVDTGAGQILTTLNSPFVDLHRLLPPQWNKGSTRVQVGLGGETRVFAAHARSIELGQFMFHDLAVELSRDKSGLFASSDFDGILGGEMLRRFKVIFDYSRQRVILEPNPQIAGL